jgi:2-keto-4-pentenoate hydratase/2-oxohepta-3-ene-1,7-dioic acid hydratase in catechol pathway
MRIGFFDDYRLGLFEGDSVVDVTDLANRELQAYPQILMEGVIGNWEALRARFDDAIRTSSKRHPISAVRIRAPLPRPRQILCSIRNYADDRRSEEVDFFLKSPSAIIGPAETIHLRTPNAQGFAFEAEIAVVMGKTASRVSRSRALESVLGYVPFIDVTARGMLRNQVYSFFLGKSADTFAPVGPYITTADEVPNPNDLTVAIKVNGETRQQFSTKQMTTQIPELIEFASSVTTLEPGDLIATGTHHAGRRELLPGDSITIEIQQLGSLTLSVD